MNRRIEIVGGGLAGLSLGIGLRQREIPVTLWEAGTYPRHRVCGEFISGKGVDTLDRLGLLKTLRNAGAIDAVNTLFAYRAQTTPVKPLPQPALCLSRYILDELLAGEFSRLGGELNLRSRWAGEYRDGVVSAVGRRADRATKSDHYLGLKVHARRVCLDADLEMHFVPSGYVGLGRLTDDRVNICGLFRARSKSPDLSERWRDWLRGPEESILRSRLDDAEFEEDSFCATAGFSLEPRFERSSEEVRIGDALTMIPPLTGNGMSMAFESAELCVEPISQYSGGECSWKELKRSIDWEIDRRFKRRLLWASRLHPLLFSSIPRSSLMFMASRSDWFWEKVFSLTR